MTKPQARLSDLTICNLCIPTPAGPVPGPSPIMPPCAPTVLVGCLPAATSTCNTCNFESTSHATTTRA